MSLRPALAARRSGRGAAASPMKQRRVRLAAVGCALLAVTSAQVSTAGVAGASALPGPVVGGEVSLPGGGAAPGLHVTVLLPEMLPTAGRHPAVSLGTATTDSAGRWSVRLPARLPAQAQARADANDGVLNVLAVTTAHTADGVAETAVAALAVGVGKSSGDTDASRRARSVMSDQGAVRLEVVDASAQRSSAVRARAPGSSESASTIAGQDYSGVPVQPDITSCEPGIFYTKHISTTGAYTLAGEAHAYYDAVGSFTYSSTASTDLSVGVSYNYGSTFSVAGNFHVGNSMGFSSGYSRGPQAAYQWKVPVLYSKDEIWEQCFGGDQYDKTTVTAQKVSLWSGGANGAYGANVIGKDGEVAYDNSNPAYRAVVLRNSFFAESSGRAQTYSGAASIFGFSVTGTTSYGTTREQKISAGSGLGEHDIWGRYGLPGSTSDLVFYSW